MRRKNTPQEAKKSREKKVRKSQARKQRASQFQQSTPDQMAELRAVSAHNLNVLLRHRFPAPGE